MLAGTKESVDNFVAITQAKREEAEKFLELTEGNLQAAVNLYMEAGGPVAHLDSQNKAVHGSPNSGVAQLADKHERRRQRQPRVSDEASGVSFANILDDPFGLGTEAAPFATAPASHGRQNWTAVSGSGWPTGGSSAWPAMASVAQPPAVPSRAVGAIEPTIQVNNVPATARRRNVPRFDDAILDALQDLPSDTLAAMLRRLAQQRPAEFSEAMGQKAPTAGPWLVPGVATSAKSPWLAAAEPAPMARQNSGLDPWPLNKPGASPSLQKATPSSSRCCLRLLLEPRGVHRRHNH